MRSFLVTISCAALLGALAPSAWADEPVPAVKATAAQPPPLQAHWDFVDGDTVPIQVRNASNVLGGEFVTVDVTINGKPGTFLLDTATPDVLLTPDFAQTLGLASAEGSNVPVKMMEFGRSVLHDVTAVVAALHQTGVHLDGVLGYPVFEGAIVDVALKQRQMAISDPARFAPTVGDKSYVLDIDLSHREPETTARIADSYRVFHPILGTGDDLLMADRVRVVFTTGRVARVPSVAGGKDPLFCGHASYLTLGSIRYDDAIVCFPERRDVRLRGRRSRHALCAALRLDDRLPR